MGIVWPGGVWSGMVWHGMGANGSLSYDQPGGGHGLGQVRRGLAGLGTVWEPMAHLIT
jgi:hypothetical protein